LASYTTAEDLDVPAISDRYRLHDVQISPLKGGAANSSFRLTAREGEFVLTVLDNHDPASARQLARRTQQLFALGIPTTEVIPDRDGDLAPIVGAKPVCLKRWIEGEVIDPLPEHLLPAAGALLAQLHNLPTDLSDLPDLPMGTRRLSADHEARIDDFDDLDFASWLTEQLEVIKEHEARHKRAPVIAHGDLFADNIICRPDGSLAVIDWETVSLDDPILDLGMAAVGLAQDQGQLSPDRLHLLVTGYTDVRPLPPGDLDELPTEVTHAAVIIAFHRFYRHHVRFPDPAKADYHRAMIGFVDSLELARVGSPPVCEATA
jgi:Ser/Thr protein kinase RdoA (MazF antagonist)